MMWPLLLACPAPYFDFGTFELVAAAAGGAIATAVLVRPYTRKLVSSWGWPRFRLTDLASLMLLSLVPIALGRLVVGFVPPATVIASTLVWTACVAYWWARGTWLLEQNGVTRFWRRQLFLAVLAPGMFLLGATAGLWLLAACTHRGELSPQLIVGATLLLLSGAPALAIALKGLPFVFDPDPDR